MNVNPRGSLHIGTVVFPERGGTGKPTTKADHSIGGSHSGTGVVNRFRVAAATVTTGAEAGAGAVATTAAGGRGRGARGAGC